MSLFDVIKYPIDDSMIIPRSTYNVLPCGVRKGFEEKLHVHLKNGSQWSFTEQAKYIRKLLLEHDEPI